MWRYLLIGSAAAGAIALFAAPSADQPPDRPSGRLVLGLHPPERVAVVDVRTGRTIVRPLPGGTLCHGPLIVSGGRLIRSGSAGRRPTAVSTDLGLEGRGQEAHQFVPSATPGRLWLATMRYGRSVTALRSVREVAVDGRTTFVARHRAPGLNLVGALSDGLLFEKGRHLLVWDPRRGKVVRSMPGEYVVAVHGRRVAWCRGDCAKVHVTGPRGDRVFSLPGPEGFEGAFSPDGSVLAAAVRGGRIALVDIARKSVRLVPGARVGIDGSLAWAPDGRWLFFATPRGRLMAYRPGARRPEVLPGRVRGNVLSLAAG